MQLKLSDYDYHLHPDSIAQGPASPRDSCRLLILNRKTGKCAHDYFYNIGRYLDEKDLLVLNNTKVMPARIFGNKETGGKVELLLLHETEKNVWVCLVRPGRRLLPETIVHLNGNGIQAEIIRRNPDGTRLTRFSGTKDIREILPSLGKIPFPPYVTKPTCSPEEYQTIYAKWEGSVAAPTAGLHFTRDLIQNLLANGVAFSEITLHVGWGTFRPVRLENIENHEMEKEEYSISSSDAGIINQAKSNGGRIIAVGTTACRVLESIPRGPLQPACGWTNLFIYPGFQFNRVDALITNFHLPKSTLLMLVSAFAGREKIMEAYQEAINSGYRFYSFGDAMLIL